MLLRSISSLITAGFLVIFLLSTPPTSFAQSQSSIGPRVFQELLDYSLKEKKGLTFFVQGQTIAGVVTKILSEEAVEVRNQTSNRIIIRLDRIDAVAAN